MVITKDRQGISCDLCGTEYRNKFEYYSAKIDKAVVDRDLSKTGVVDVDRRHMDLDICTSCWNKIVETVKQVIEKREVQKSKDERNKASEWRK